LPFAHEKAISLRDRRGDQSIGASLITVPGELATILHVHPSALASITLEDARKWVATA
jgi:hypothetical protein